MKIQTDQKLQSLQVLLFVVMICAFSFTLISDYDFWWHLSLGRDIFTSGFSALTDNLSYTFAGVEQFRGEWLADLLLFLSVKIGGIGGANGVLFLTLLTTFFFLYKTLEVEPAAAGESRFYSRLLTLILVLFAIRFRLFVRPYIFSYLFVAIFLYLLTRYRQERDVRLLYLLPLVEILWANMSKGAFFGPVILLLFCGDHLFRHPVDRRPLLALGATLLASLLSPEGYHLYVDLLKFTLQGSDAVAVGEHQPLTAQLLWGYGLKYTFGYQLLFLLAALSFLFLRGWKDSFHLALFLLFFIPSLFMVRMIDFFAIASPLFVAPALQRLLPPARQRQLERKAYALLATVLLVALILFATIGGQTYTLGVGVKGDTFPEKSLAFVNRHNIQGRMFNSYPFGGYLSWFAPERPVFIDGRVNQLYPPEFHKEYQRMLHTPAAWQAADEKWNFDYAIVEYEQRSFGQHFPKHLLSNPAWALVYWDNISAVYLKKTPANTPVIEKFEYKVAKPNFYDFSYVTQQMKLYEPTKILNQLDREIDFNPQNQEPRLLKAYILFSMNKKGALNQQILNEIDKCLQLKPDLAMEHSAKALILFEEKRADEAVAEVKRALEIDPNDESAKFVGEKLKLKL